MIRQIPSEFSLTFLRKNARVMAKDQDHEVFAYPPGPKVPTEERRYFHAYLSDGRWEVLENARG